MKKSVCIVVCLTMLLLMTACGQADIPSANTVKFYYIHNELQYGTESGVITPAVINGQYDEDDYQLLLEKYLNGPTDYESISPFPAGITLKDFQIVGEKALLVLSPHMGTLSGSSMTVALACLTRTVIEMTGVEAVQISIENQQINGVDFITLTLNNFSFWDDV
mgnify:CR=1 FL=1